jgi:hypothetical protein
MFNKSIAVIICFAIAYIYGIKFAPYIREKKGKIFNKLNKMHESCIFKCKYCKHFTKMRGSGYIIGENHEDKTRKRCLITWWSLTHILFYASLAYIAPDYIPYFFAIGILFELYEYHYYKCHDVLDILWNTIGLFIGYNLHKML